MLKKWPISVALGLLCIVILAGAIVALQIRNKQSASSTFPKMESADTLHVYDIRNDSAEAKLAALTLQGLINQSSAEVYVLTREKNLDQLWLDQSGKSYSPVSLVTGSNPGLRTMYRDYQSLIDKFIVWEGSKDWTFNIALMKGALEAGLPVTDGIRSSLISEFGSQSVEDIRSNWNGRVDAYKWAVEHLMPSLDKRILFSAGLRLPDWVGYPWNIFDYAVASKSFTFYLDPRNPDEYEEMKHIIQEGGYPPGTAVLGYAPNADDLNEYTNPLGVGYVVSDFFSNGSVWSSFENKTYTQPAGAAVDAEPGKVYVSITASDGDNLQYAQQLMDYFQDPAKGDVPVGITIAPVLRELGSPILDYLYAEKGDNIELVAGPSGYQFIYPNHYSIHGYETWLNENKKWLTDAGVHTANVWRIPLNSVYHKQMVDSLAGSGVTGILRGDDVQPINAYHGIYTLSQGNMLTRDGDIYSILSSVSEDREHPVFYNLYPILAFYGVDDNGEAVFFERLKDEVARLQQDFPGKYVFLKPQDIVATIKKLNTDIEGVSFEADNSSAETLYLYEDNHSAMDEGYRYADGDASWIYKFDLADDIEQATLTLDIGGDYEVDVSKDGTNWSAAARANGNMNRTTLDIDLVDWLTNNPSKTIYVRFKSGNPQGENGMILYYNSLSILY
ncbi:hypothetical protein B1748_14050 [Paenibacillus sp. MY03]|uniref:GxGYxYP domain-containing protein n=1 Tax=Paenibacillus sp. MY03 TaxID=302980 RepID=UPI000B3D037D|nr:GxGYxYP domain-containing protein [Paenibacillus sp. MY03]OUS75935.1 hypothetical protein B1748_14050 [Paenibacillus sp. MY03]